MDVTTGLVVKAIIQCQQGTLGREVGGARLKPGGDMANDLRKHGAESSGDLYRDADVADRDAFDQRMELIGVEYGPTIVAPLVEDEGYVGRHRRDED
jgi:hypothetical protein